MTENIEEKEIVSEVNEVTSEETEVAAEEAGMTREIKVMNIREFLEGGFLQEANRKFFHPLGLSMEAVTNQDNNNIMLIIWDCREDEQGIFFSENAINVAKSEKIEELRQSKLASRKTFAKETPSLTINTFGIQMQ